MPEDVQPHGNGVGGVLVVRAWLEPEAEPALRCRVTSRVDVLAGNERVLALTDERAVLAEVTRWLAQVGGDTGRSASPPLPVT